MTQRKHKVGIALFIVAMMSLAGCVQPPVPVDRFYRLAIDAAAPRLDTPALSGTVIVDRFDSDSLVRQRSVVFSQSTNPLELRQYTYHYWAQSPPVMIQDRLISYLRAANAATTVDAREARQDAGCRITGVIRRFERVLGDDSTGAAVEIDMRVTRVNDLATLWRHDYVAAVAAQSGAMADTVAAFDTAIAVIFGAFVGHLAQQPATCPTTLGASPRGRGQRPAPTQS